VPLYIQNKFLGLLLIGFVLIGIISFIPKVSPIGERVSDFSLKNVDGKTISLKDYDSAKGLIVVFTCNHCPFAKLYPPRMNALNERYQKLGVPLIAISSTDPRIYEEDTYELMIEKSKKEKFNFPYLFDEKQVVAKQFEAQKTPHAFVLWKKEGQWVIAYSGAIDDNGAEPSKVTQRYVGDAVEALLNNKEVLIKETKSIGCKIYISN
jgi:peroxiredoxin